MKIGNERSVGRKENGMNMRGGEAVLEPVLLSTVSDGSLQFGCQEVGGWIAAVAVAVAVAVAATAASASGRRVSLPLDG
jgi:hypothetical protein